MSHRCQRARLAQHILKLRLASNRTRQKNLEPYLALQVRIPGAKDFAKAAPPHQLQQFKATPQTALREPLPAIVLLDSDLRIGGRVHDQISRDSPKCPEYSRAFLSQSKPTVRGLGRLHKINSSDLQSIHPKARTILSGDRSMNNSAIASVSRGLPRTYRSRAERNLLYTPYPSIR